MKSGVNKVNAYFDFAFTQLMDSYNGIFILALITAGLALFCMFGKIFAAHLLLLFAFYAAAETWRNPVFWLLVVLQLALSAWTFIQIVIEIEGTSSQRQKKD